MQVSVETTSALERRMTVGIPAEKIDTAVESKLVDTAKRVRIDGFRPGKVPMREVRRRFARAIREEVIGDMLGRFFYEAATKESLNPAGYPAIERTKDAPGQDFEFVATFEVYPEVKVKGLDQISVVRPVAEIQESDIDTMIGRLRDQRATFADVDRAAQQGDQVIIDFAGTKDGEAFQGGSGENVKLVLGSGQMIPGFEDGLVGASKGEERVLSLTFPAEYHSEELKGQAAQFAVTVKAVQEKQLPEVNEEFIKTFVPKGVDLDAFRAEIRANMERELRNAIKNRVKTQVLDGVLAHNGEVPVPKALIDSEIDRQRQQMVQQFGGGMNFDFRSLPAELFEKQATRAVKLGLLLAELIKERQIKADGTRVRAVIEEMAQPYENPQQVVAWHYENKQALQQVEAMVLEDQVVDVILEQAQLTDQAMSYEEAAKQPAGQIDDEEA